MKLQAKGATERPSIDNWYHNSDKYSNPELTKTTSSTRRNGSIQPIERQTAELTKNQKEQWDREGKYEWNLFKK